MSQCCEVLTFPRGGEIGLPGIPGESGIQGIQGIQGASGLNGQIPVNQTLKFVKEFRPNNQMVPPFTHIITITQAELSAAGMLRPLVWWNYNGFPGIGTFKINVFFYSTGFGFYQDIKHSLTSVIVLNSIVTNPGGNITVNITNNSSQIRDIRIVING